MTIVNGLDLIITRKGFEVGPWSDSFGLPFRNDKYVALLRLSFLKPLHTSSYDSKVLYGLGREFVYRLVRTEGLGDNPLETDVPFDDTVMFVLPEHSMADKTWAKGIWKWLLEAFRRDFRKFDGPLDLYFERVIHGTQPDNPLCLHLIEWGGKHILSMTYLDVVDKLYCRRVPLSQFLHMNRNDLTIIVPLLDILDRMKGCGWPLWDIVESGSIIQPIEISDDEFRGIIGLIPLLEAYGIECYVPYSEWIPYTTHAWASKTSKKDCWWSSLWIEHYRKYADDPKRLRRGESIASVDDYGPIPVLPGHLFCTINGSKGRQYHVDVRMDLPSESDTRALESRLRKDHAAMDDMRAGRLPLYLSDSLRFGDIHATCDCPDNAVMCKHIASVVARLGIMSNNDPSLLFRLLGIDTAKVWKMGIIERLQTLLEGGRTSNRRLPKDEEDEVWRQLDRTYHYIVYEM